MIHFVAHVLGIDTQHSWAYDFWSGSATQLPMLGALATLYRRHNCHVRRCPRIGRHAEAGHLLCHRHHHTGALSAAQARTVGSLPSPTREGS